MSNILTKDEKIIDIDNIESDHDHEINILNKN
jgi:hypothetical protein